MNKLSEPVQATINDALKETEKYFESTNQILGVLAVTTGIGCFGTANVKFYSAFSLIFLVLAWVTSFQGYRHRLRMLKIINHPNMTPWYIIKRCYVAFLGWVFLLAILYGVIDTNGWHGL
jgi:hypothetical protein